MPEVKEMHISLPPFHQASQSPDEAEEDKEWRQVVECQERRRQKERKGNIGILNVLIRELSLHIIILVILEGCRSFVFVVVFVGGRESFKKHSTGPTRL